jgi:hypothetical protein
MKVITTLFESILSGDNGSVWTPEDKTSTWSWGGKADATSTWSWGGKADATSTWSWGGKVS